MVDNLYRNLFCGPDERPLDVSDPTVVKADEQTKKLLEGMTESEKWEFFHKQSEKNQ